MQIIRYDTTLQKAGRHVMTRLDAVYFIPDINVSCHLHPQPSGLPLVDDLAKVASQVAEKAASLS